MEKRNDQEYQQSYYQKNAEKKKIERMKRYQEEKQRLKKELAARINKYSQVENYKVLITFKEYTLLNKDKQQKWFDFSRTLKDLADNGVHDTSELMRLGELAEVLIIDYRTTAQQEEFKGKRWNALTERKKEKFIKFWAKEKIRQELVIAEGLAAINERAKEGEKEFEMAKFHEERGKIKCDCWQCQASKEIRAEIKKERKTESKAGIKKVKCPECSKLVKKLEEESGVCKKCVGEIG